jgi:hypothetical protein
MIKLKDLLSEACWKGYRQFGMKKKGKRQVPNCVPVDEEIVTEVGEGSVKPYKFEEVDQEGRFVYIRFTTDKGTEYEVDLESMEYPDPDDEDMNVAAMGIEFLAKQKGKDGYSSKITTNEGDIFKVMSTVSDIIKKYLKKRIFSDVEYLIYTPSKKPDQSSSKNQRDMLYRKFITYNFSGAKFITDSNGWIVAKIK